MANAEAPPVNGEGVTLVEVVSVIEVAEEAPPAFTDNGDAG
ncbi:MAG: hypothetical protein R3C44_09730 [Chloroflexota bacterium]